MSLKLVACLLIAFSCVRAERRPFGPGDYDKWKHIQNQQLSPDGRYLAYAAFPQQGDGEVVVRDLSSGKEIHQGAGELPPPPPPNNAAPQVEEGPPPPPGISIKFSSDSQKIVFLSFPRHDLVEQAKRAKRKTGDMPKGDLVVINLSAGTASRVERVINFQLPVKGSKCLAYLQEPVGSTGEKSHENAEEPAAAASASNPSRSRRVQTGDLVIRNLSDGSERRFSEVAEYLLAKDGNRLVFAVASRKLDSNGVFTLNTTETAAQPSSLISGSGEYERLAWDADETVLAFLSNRRDAGAKQPDFKLYAWDGKSPKSTELASSQAAGMKAGWILSDHSPLTVSKGGRYIFFGAAPKPKPEEPPDLSPADEKLSVDLWSWKDDYIQPMQKVRASVERTRTYRGVWNVSAKRLLQLGDPEMNDVVPSDDGAYAIGSDDREYRRMQEYDERLQDSYLVDVSTGARKLVAKTHSGRVLWSPDSRHAIFFDGKGWNLISAPDGKVKNLTASLGVSFGREQYDQPGHPPSEGPAIWTADGRYVLLYDHFDIWRIGTEDGKALNLTHSAGRAGKLSFRIVRFDQNSGMTRGIHASKPLLLRAENEQTRDTGFYRTTIDATAPPTELLMAAKNFAPPVKATNADVYATAASTFSEYPDLLVTDSTFRDLRKVTDLASQLNEYRWGSAELVHFEGADGVPLQAILYKPDNFDPKKKYPMIVYIYERLTQNLNLFVEPKPMDSINPSVYVSNGYLVLEPDITYKIGYPGESALNCVLSAVQEIVEKGFVNEKAIGIQGHSWGGYQVAYMITRTNRFRAAEAGAPVPI